MNNLLNHIKNNSKVYLKGLLLIQILILIPVIIALFSLSITAYIDCIIIIAAYHYFRLILVTLTKIGKTIN